MGFLKILTTEYTDSFDDDFITEGQQLIRKEKRKKGIKQSDATLLWLGKQHGGGKMNNEINNNKKTKKNKNGVEYSVVADHEDDPDDEEWGGGGEDEEEAIWQNDNMLTVLDFRQIQRVVLCLRLGSLIWHMTLWANILHSIS